MGVLRRIRRMLSLRRKRRGALLWRIEYGVLFLGEENIQLVWMFDD